MKGLKIKMFGVLLLLLGGCLQAQNLDSIPLINIDSSTVQLDAFHESPAIVLVFTGNHCVYSKKYETRLIEMAKEYQGKGLPFFLVNSNAPDMSADDRLDLMRRRAREKNYPCPYLKDAKGDLAMALGASKNPEAYVLKWMEGKYEVLYSGKIDDNPLMAERVKQHYLRNALEKVVNGDFSVAEEVKPVGCGIKMHQ